MGRPGDKVKRGVQLVLCELNATLTVGLPFYLGFPSLYSFNTCVLGTEEVRVGESTGPSPQGVTGCGRTQTMPGLTIRQRRE